MRYSDIDWAHSLWSISGASSKNRKPIMVTLSPYVVRILVTRRDSSRSPFVFPGRGASGHLESPKRCFKRILQRAKISDLRVHDLRRTLGSWQAIQGSSMLTIGASLNHRDAHSTAIYARLSVDPVRESVERANAALLKNAPVALLGN